MFIELSEKEVLALLVLLGNEASRASLSSWTKDELDNLELNLRDEVSTRVEQALAAEETYEEDYNEADVDAEEVDGDEDEEEDEEFSTIKLEPGRYVVRAPEGSCVTESYPDEPEEYTNVRVEVYVSEDPDVLPTAEFRWSKNKKKSVFVDGGDIRWIKLDEAGCLTLIVTSHSSRREWCLSPTLKGNFVDEVLEGLEVGVQHEVVID